MTDVAADEVGGEDTTPQPSRYWIVTAKVEGKNPGDAKTKGLTQKAIDKLTGANAEAGLNQGGVTIFIASSDGEPQEVGRVAFIRENSDHPEKSHQQALDEMIGVANHAMTVLNNQELIVAELLATTHPGRLS